MTIQKKPTFRAGDIVAFKYPYRQGISPYARPCLVLEATTREILLAYGTTSRSRANAGFEIRVNAAFSACGLSEASRFVLARRIRIDQQDRRLTLNTEGSPIIGRLTEDLIERKQFLVDLIARTWGSPNLRHQAERKGINPPKSPRRRRGRQLLPCL